MCCLLPYSSLSHFYERSAGIRLQCSWSCPSSSTVLSPCNLLSHSNHVLFGPPLLIIFPCIYFPITLFPRQSSSHPYPSTSFPRFQGFPHLKSCCPSNVSVFLIQSSFATLAHPSSIHISATSKFFSGPFFATHVVVSNSSAGLTWVQYRYLYIVRIYVQK